MDTSPRSYALRSALTIAIALSLLAVLAPTSLAVAPVKVGVCHATSSDSAPYQYIEVDASSTTFEGHLDHKDTPTKTWKRAGTWNGIAHSAGDPKPDILGFQPDGVTPIDRAYCTTRGADPVSEISLTKFVATGASAPVTECGGAGWSGSVNVAPGDPIHWCLAIENTGDDALKSIVVLDDLDLAVPVNAAGCALSSTLALDELDDCSYSTTASVGTHTNYASVTGKGEDSKDDVSDTASASYTATAPQSGIDLTKFVATGASAPVTECGGAGWSASVNVTTGAPIHWCLRIENTGDDALSSVVVLDDLDVPVPVGAAGCPLSATLAIAGADDCSYSTTAAVGTHTNHASVSGAGDVTGDPVTDTASASYTATDPIITVRDPDPEVLPEIIVAEDPSIDLIKTASEPADGTAFTEGDEVTYTYVITNTGDVTLTDLTLLDDKLGDLTDSITVTSLDPDESTEVTTTYLITEADAEAGSITNVADTTGTSPEGEVVDATDDETIEVEPTEVLGIVIDNPPAPAPAPEPAPQAAPVEVAAEQLPRTGTEPAPATAMALFMMALGALLLRKTQPE